MVSFTLLLSAATLVLGSTSSAFKLSEASSPLENIILQDEYGDLERPDRIFRPGRRWADRFFYR